MVLRCCEPSLAHIILQESESNRSFWFKSCSCGGTLTFCYLILNGRVMGNGASWPTAFILLRGLFERLPDEDIYLIMAAASSTLRDRQNNFAATVQAQPQAGARASGAVQHQQSLCYECQWLPCHKCLSGLVHSAPVECRCENCIGRP